MLSAGKEAGGSTLYTFWDNITHYKTKSVHFWGAMNSAAKVFYKVDGRRTVRRGLDENADIASYDKGI